MHDIPPMTGTELHTIRTSHGLSLVDTAHILGVNERTARRWEAGTSPIPAGVAAEVLTIDETIDRIADRIAAEWRDADGLWSVDISDPPAWAAAVDPAVWNAGAARAVERHGVRLTSTRDLP